jgi:hypothetical protein
MDPGNGPTSKRAVRFKYGSGQYRGKPTSSKFNQWGLLKIVVVPTQDDLTRRFADEPGRSSAVDREMEDVQDPTIVKTLQESIAGFGSKFGSSYDSMEMSVDAFSDPSKWPERSDLSCWWCLHKFDTRPFPCPYSKSPFDGYRVRGIFCGPSCAKAWALGTYSEYSKPKVLALVDELARSRGFIDESNKRIRAIHIPVAPPRETLQMFSGRDGFTIEEFRALCAVGMDVKVLDPPFITHKQVVVAECDKLMQKTKRGQSCHRENPESMHMSAMELASRKQRGFQIFAGVGARRLTDFLGPQNCK